MTTYFITRHPGARAWVAEEGIPIDQVVEHLDPSVIRPGDWVVGTLPVNLAAEICERGGRYFHLALTLSRDSRGRELTPEQMRTHGARLQEYRVMSVPATIIDPTDQQPPGDEC